MGHADEEVGKEFAFKIITPERTLYLHADSKDEQEEWMMELEKRL